jgi:tight adherence protein C
VAVSLIFVVPVFVFAGLLLASYATVAAAADHAAARDLLRSLDGYDIETVRQHDVDAPLLERMAHPFGRLAKAVTKRLWPPQYVAETRRRLLLAGITGPAATDRFLAARMVGFALTPGWFLLAFNVLSGLSALSCALLLTACSVLGPKVWLTRRTKDRQLAISRALPDILDILTISVEAGLGFEQAVDRVVRSIPGTLSDEFGRMLGETRAGASRAEGLRAIDERTDMPELRSFILAVMQADTFGVSIGRILRAQADELRVKRRQQAQERAQKAPIKMLVPMVFCIFPALFVVVIGPAVLNITSGLK